MNTSLVKVAPQGDFTEVSVLVNGWQNKFENLLSQNRPIKYDMYPMPHIPPEIRQRLAQKGYRDIVWEKDQWQHFLLPAVNADAAKRN
jgi:hypothetical protein